VSAAESFRYLFAAAPCGGLHLDLAGREVLCRASGALWIEAQGALVVADLHFEKGSAYAQRGQLLPPYDTAETLRRLEAEVEVLAPRQLVFLGDSFHDRGAEGRLAPELAARIARLAFGRTLIWIVGNHDADGPQILPGESVDEIGLAGLILRHEPRPAPARGELSGHLHPCARVRGKGQSVRRRCFATDGERMVLPAFGAFTGGLNVRDAAFAGLFLRAPIVGCLGRERVHAVSWKQLGGD
jgi:DNA ligase-associated metallophosphoesterase